MTIDLVVATTINGVIGKDGDMPWSMPNDLRNFKNVTTIGESNYVVMGRSTYDSIGGPLPGRTNIVITRNRDEEETAYIDAIIVHSIEEAIDLCKGYENMLKKECDVHIIGGASIYDQVMEMGIVEKIYHTLIKAELEGDTFFHVPTDWRLKSEKVYLKDEKHAYDYSFRILTKIQD